MLKQSVKTLTMLTLVVGLALVATVVSANGQTKSPRLTANIPFDFIVGDKTLPSGEYVVSSATDDGAGVRISSHNGKSSAIRLSQAVPERTKSRNARMVFHRYGQQYFLAQVWSGSDYGRALMQCNKERNLRRELESIAAKRDSGPGNYQIVEVVAMVR
ncbi:MAG TPA: hypothetical protein VF075_01250 [Pyrinomonadaceae bacterium]